MLQLAVKHNFETAHRLPQLGGKCTNLHGHSWWVQVEVAAPVPATGVLVDFGRLKARLRGWIDHHLDHGAMLGHADPLLPVLVEADSKVYTFGVVDAAELEWPTVENVATLLARIAGRLVDELRADGATAPGLHLQRVTVTETAVNEATWTAP